MPKILMKVTQYLIQNYFASTLKTPDFCLVIKECKIQNKFLSKEDSIHATTAMSFLQVETSFGSPGGYSFGLKDAKQTLELLRSRRLVSAECHFHNILSKLSFVSPCFIVVSVFLFIFSSAGLTAELTPEQRARIQLLDTSTIQTPSERLNYSVPSGTTLTASGAPAGTCTDALVSERLGDSYYSQRKLDDALSSYLDAAKRYAGTGKEISVKRRIAICYLNMGKYKEGIETCQAIINNSSKPTADTTEAHYDLGSYYAFAGQKESAVSEYKTVIDFWSGKNGGDYTTAYAYAGIGGCYKDGEMPTEKTREYCRKAMDIMQNARNIEDSVKSYFIAEQYLVMGEKDKAYSLFEDAEARYKANPGFQALVNFYLGFILLGKGEYTKALEKFEKGISFKPEGQMLTRLQYHIGYCYWKLEKFEDAYKHLEIASSVTQAPPFLEPHIFYFKGMSLMALGRYKEAGESFHIVTDKYPYTGLAPDARSHPDACK